MSDLVNHEPLVMQEKTAAPRRRMVGDHLALLKPRVMSLVVFTALVGLLLSPASLPLWQAATAIACIAVGAGAAGALNMWYDRDIDAVMRRTARRPLPAGRVAPRVALAYGTVLALLSVFALGLTTNWLAAGLLAATISFYVFVYTGWLKRRTPQNIVIGGAAGALPPVIGWAAATGEVTLSSLSLFAIIFLWTPPHFWALALCRSADYAAAGVPMMPVVAGRRATQRQMLFYAALLIPAAPLPALLGAASPLYGVAAAAAGCAFLWQTILVWLRDSNAEARRLFGLSILYLTAIFALLLVDRLVGALA